MNRTTVIVAVALLSIATLGRAERRRAARQPARPAIEVVDVAGSRVAGADDGPVASARFSSPRGVAFDSTTRTIVVADTANHTIRRIAGGSVTTIAGAALQGGSIDGPGLTARFRLPHGVAVDSRGRIWIADTANHVIRRIENDGSVVTVAGSAGNAGDTDAAPLASRFRFPEAIAIESETSVVVADTGNHKLRRITSDRVSTIATATALRAPAGVAIETDGSLLVSEREAGAVRRIAPNGVETIAASDLLSPAGVAVIGDSRFVAESCNHNVRQIPSGSKVVEGLQYPEGLSAGDGELLIADSRHHVIRALRGLR